VVVGLAAVVVTAAVAVGAIWLAGSQSGVEIFLGDRDFRDMDAERISNEIAQRGPILFGDVASGELDIILQHLGDDPSTGWLAFEARRFGQARDCFFNWDAAESLFVNSCDTSDTVDAVGTGLRQFNVDVVNGDVRVDVGNQ